MRRRPHSNSKMTARQHVIAARFRRIRAFLKKHDKMPPNPTGCYFAEEDFVIGFGERPNRNRFAPAHTPQNGYPAPAPAPA